MNSLIRWLLQTEAGRRIEIQVLMNLVTQSLGLPRRNLMRMPSDRALDAFAAYTAEHLGTCNGEQQHTLHANALRLGARLRRCLTHRTPQDLTELTFVLYQNIGISMEGCFPGQVTVRHCHFCHYYSPHVCSVASLMDTGVISGLFGAGKLVFHERITEGRTHCQCTLK